MLFTLEITSLPTLEISMILDYFSKFLIVRKLPTSTTGAIVKELSITFSEYGIPFIIQSDNGPCYSSQEFKTFLQDLQVTHHTSSPHYPQSNGIAESMVKVSKNLIEKQSNQTNHGIPSSRNIELHHYRAQFQVQQKYCLEGNSDPTFLSCPHSSPTAELHISVTKLPRRKTNSMKKPTPVADLVPGQPIWHQDPLTKKWLPGTVQEKLQEPHSYSIISQDTTAMYRRNRNHLKP